MSDFKNYNLVLIDAALLKAENISAEIDIRYATNDNFTGVPVYKNPICYLHTEAWAKFKTAVDIAAQFGLRFKIFDAFRPSEAQWVLWNHTPDPWKGFNTGMFRFNNALDQYFLAPLARGYRFVMPQWGRDRVTEFFNNLGEPANLVNGLMQGDMEASFRAFWRFMINSSFGVGGMHDVAGGFGLHERDKPFSQTLMVYGIETGPYLVVPFMGPSTPRDFVSELFDEATSPTTYLSTGASYAFGGAEIISRRERFLDFTDDAQRNSFDLYSTYKSSYIQHRKKKVLKTVE